MVSIKKVSFESIPIIHFLAYKIWPATYGDILSSVQMEYMLQLIYSETSLKKQIEEGQQFILVSWENEIVGFASYSQKDNSSVYKLHKIYVDPNKQGKGIGKKVIIYVCEDIKPANASTLELNVNRHNPALNFYEKLGFEIIKEEDIDIGNGYFMNDYVMQLRIAPNP